MPCRDGRENQAENEHAKKADEQCQMFCQLCKTLTREQMEEIISESAEFYESLFDWYIEHLEQDANSKDNDIEIIKSECDRLGCAYEDGFGKFEIVII